MKKWEPYVVDLHGDADSEFKMLNVLSERGWELISVVQLPQFGRRAYFKREKLESHIVSPGYREPSMTRSEPPEDDKTPIFDPDQTPPDFSGTTHKSFRCD